MVQKRQLAEEEYDVSPKHLKLENSCHLVSCLEFVPLKSCNSVIAEIEEHFSVQNIQSEKDLVKSEPPIHPVDTYSHLLHFPPLKQVPVGPQYQADIPELQIQNTSNTSNENKFLGSCVIKPDLTISNEVGTGRSHCCCEYPGSVTCVRLHIIEARENLRGEIGHGRFSDLGFWNMGETVACKWSEEDERLFHEVVYSNPVSLGQNFWDHLSDAFPSRTNREIVSYYFNVFVLQRRSEQNRCESMNADSDDDEWQGSDESSSEEEEEEDVIREYGFGIESPFILHDYNQTLIDENSCTSSESQASDFMFEPTDSYFSFSRNESDFLPTGSMIEEVFGVESWDGSS